MTKPTLILSMMMSLDGYVAGRQGELDWVHWENEMDDAASALLGRVNAFAAGHNAFQSMARYWPAVLSDAQARPAERAFAQQLSDKHKAVLGRKTDQFAWKDEFTVDCDDIAAAVSSIKRELGSVVVYGGVSTARALISRDLVDELQLFVSPILIGDGQSLFASKESWGPKYKAVASKVFSSGGASLNLVRHA